MLEPKSTMTYAADCTRCYREGWGVLGNLILLKEALGNFCMAPFIVFKWPLISASQSLSAMSQLNHVWHCVLLSILLALAYL